MVQLNRFSSDSLTLFPWPADGRRGFGEIVLLLSSDAIKALIAGVTVASVEP